MESKKKCSQPHSWCLSAVQRACAAPVPGWLRRSWQNSSEVSLGTVASRGCASVETVVPISNLSQCSYPIPEAAALIAGLTEGEIEAQSSSGTGPGPKGRSDIAEQYPWATYFLLQPFFKGPQLHKVCEVIIVLLVLWEDSPQARALC